MAEDLTKEILPIEEQKQAKKIFYKNWKVYAIALGIITVGLSVGLGIGFGVQNSSHNTISQEQKIVNEINKITSFEITANKIESNITAKDISDKINTDFISTKLTGDNKLAFKANKFTLINITIGDNNHALTDSDLANDGIITAKINYTYDTIKNQNTNLTINVAGSKQRNIINAINAITYETNVEINSTIADLIITPEFIHTKLSFDAKENFNLSLFKLNKIAINGKDLQASDLTEAKTLNAQINYDYDAIKNQTTNLKLIIDTNIWTDKTIVDFLKKTHSTANINYDKTTATVASIKTEIINMLAKSITSKTVQESVKNTLTVDSLYTSAGGKKTDITDERLRNGETSNNNYLRATYTLALNNAKTTATSIHLIPN